MLTKFIIYYHFPHRNFNKLSIKYQFFFFFFFLHSGQKYAYATLIMIPEIYMRYSLFI